MIISDINDIPAGHVAFYTAPIDSGGLLVAMPYEVVDSLAQQMTRPVRLG